MTYDTIKEFEHFMTRIREFKLLEDTEEEYLDKFLLEAESAIRPQTKYFEFLTEFNKTKGVNYPPDTASRSLFYAHDHIYAVADRITALKNALTAEYFSDKIGMLTPEFVCRPKFITSFISFKPSKKMLHDAETSDYSQVQNF